MWQEQREGTLEQPFGLSTSQQCINYGLSSVEEVTKLGLPNGQHSWTGQTEAVLECLQQPNSKMKECCD